MNTSAAMVTSAVLLLGCTSAPPVYQEPDVVPQAVSATFTVSVDPAHTMLDAAWLTPVREPAAVSGGAAGLALQAWVKKLPNRPELVSVELLVDNQQDLSLRDVVAEVTAIEGSALYDLGRDGFGPATAARQFQLGGIAGRGLTRLHLGVEAGNGPVQLTLTVSGVTTARRPTSSTPIALTHDGQELWVVVPDADVVAVVDTASEQRVAQLAIGGRPSSVAVSTDDRHVLVASATGNSVSIIDRSSRQVIASFDEDDGIGREPRHVVVSPDGGRAFVSSYVGDRITALVRRGDSWAIERHLDLGRRPVGMSVTPDSGTLLVAHYLPRGRVTENQAWVSVVALPALELVREVTISDVLNLDEAHCLADAFGVSPARMTSEAIQTQLAGVFLHPSGNVGWVPHAQVAGAPVMERGPNSIELSPSFDTRPGEIMPGFVTLLDTRAPRGTDWLQNPGKLDRPVSVDYLACADLPLGIEGIDNQAIPERANQVATQFAAFPSAYAGLAPAGTFQFVAFTAGGRRALALSKVSDVIMSVDATTFHPASRQHFTLSGSNPIGMAVSADGGRGYVAYANSLYVSILDLSRLAGDNLPAPGYLPYDFREVPELPGGTNGLSTLRLVRDVSALPMQPELDELGSVALVDEDPMDPVLRRGAILFNTANVDKEPTLSGLTMTACASCHPDGGTDGSMWTTMEGERRTMSLRGGVRGRGWLHISGTHRDIEEFAAIIVKERLGGDLSAGDLHALATYVADGIPRLQPPRVDVALAARGQQLFADNCSVCHAGPQLTSGRADPDDPWGGGGDGEPALYDVGTAVDDAHVGLPTFFESLLPAQEAEILRLTRGDRDLGDADPLQQLLDFRPRPNRVRGELKAPSLINVWDHSLFFHDGRYTSLEDAVRYMSQIDDLDLGDDDIAAIVEYLKTL